MTPQRRQCLAYLAHVAMRSNSLASYDPTGPLYTECELYGGTAVDVPISQSLSVAAFKRGETAIRPHAERFVALPVLLGSQVQFRYE